MSTSLAACPQPSDSYYILDHYGQPRQVTITTEGRFLKAVPADGQRIAAGVEAHAVYHARELYFHPFQTYLYCKAASPEQAAQLLKAQKREWRKAARLANRAAAQV